MKKHDEGYVLALVLVVILVLCLVASAILTGAFCNVNAQYQQIEKMQEKYTAAGAIEILVSQLEAADTWDGKEFQEETIRQVIDDLCVAQGDIQRYGGTEESDPDRSVFAELSKTYTFTVTAEAGQRKITARLTLTLTVSGTAITAGSVSYVSYETGEVETT